jgi:hypothetical protein
MIGDYNEPASGHPAHLHTGRFQRKNSRRIDLDQFTQKLNR